MRICLISPGHLATNPRLVKEADALAGAGHEVTVVAADYLSWGRRADQAFDSRPWRIAPPVPFGPDARLSRRLHQVARHRLARLFVRNGVRHERILTLACHPAAPDLVATAAAIDADLYVAHYTAALPAAAMAARRRRARYAFDAEDFHLGDIEPGRTYEMDKRLVGEIERRWLPRCAYVTAASPGIADAYAETYGIPRPAVLLNVFPRAESPPCATPKGTAAPGPSIYWFSQTIGANRGLETAVRAIARARSRPHLFLRGAPAPAAGFVEQLTALAAQEGVVDRLHLLPPGAPDDMARLAADYDLGLSGEPGHSPNNRLALGNKLFTYLIAGVPVLASDVPAHRRFAADAAEAVRLFKAGDAGSLADGMDALLTSAAALAAARTAAFQLGQGRFNWDLEQQTLLDQIALAAAWAACS
jgi:glycosyltransferase involved in cell wall biosynthesis